jgi:hypothetical protein
MKKDILNILQWHEDATGVIPNQKFEWVVHDIKDLFEIKLNEIAEKMSEIYPEFYLGIINEEIEKL